MTNLFFQRIQMSDRTPDNHLNPPVRQRLSLFLTVVVGTILILLAVGVAIFAKTGQGGRLDETASQGHSQPAPLDLFP